MLGANLDLFLGQTLRASTRKSGRVRSLREDIYTLFRSRLAKATTAGDWGAI